MNNLVYAILLLLWGGGLLILQGCTYGPMQGPTSAGLEIYNKSARQYSGTVQLSMAPAGVYAAMQRIFAEDPEFTVDNVDPQLYLLEAVAGSRRLTLQASAVDEGSTLLFIWGDAGDSGQTGRDLVLKTATRICSELQVTCEVKEL